jgi:hypothetical protein
MTINITAQNLEFEGYGQLDKNLFEAIDLRDLELFGGAMARAERARILGSKNRLVRELRSDLSRNTLHDKKKF